MATLYHRPALLLDLKTIKECWLPACDCRATGRVIDGVCWCGGAVPKAGEATREGEPIGHWPTDNRKVQAIADEQVSEQPSSPPIFLDPNSVYG